MAQTRSEAAHRRDAAHMRGRPLLFVAALLATGACRRGQPESEGSALARHSGLGARHSLAITDGAPVHRAPPTALSSGAQGVADAPEAAGSPMHAAAASRGALGVVLREESSRAQSKGLRLFAYLHASWCPSCRALDGSLDDPRMVAAFRGTYVVSLDMDDWGAERLAAEGFEPPGIPCFYALAADGTPTGRMIRGAAWSDDTPESMAPPLSAFFHAP